jgi:hypothetical protein
MKDSQSKKMRKERLGFGPEEGCYARWSSTEFTVLGLCCRNTTLL